jgi:hypothetical protein
VIDKVWETDEEAIFAVLLAFKQNTLELQNTYYHLYHEDIRDRLVDEMSGPELDYALELLETQYEHYVQEANEKLAGAPFGSFGDVSTCCFPEEQETPQVPSGFTGTTKNTGSRTSACTRAGQAVGQVVARQKPSRSDRRDV